MLFTYEHKLDLGQNKTAMYELDCKIEIEFNGDITLYIHCYDLGDWQSVHPETDLYKEIIQHVNNDKIESYRLQDEVAAVMSGQKTYAVEVARA